MVPLKILFSIRGISRKRAGPKGIQLICNHFYSNVDTYFIKVKKKEVFLHILKCRIINLLPVQDVSRNHSKLRMGGANLILYLKKFSDSSLMPHFRLSVTTELELAQYAKRSFSLGMGLRSSSRFRKLKNFQRNKGRSVLQRKRGELLFKPKLRNSMIIVPDMREGLTLSKKQLLVTRQYPLLCHY